MRVCTFHTNSVYFELAQRLEESCKAFDIPFYVEPANDKGGWMANIHHKAPFLLSMTLIYPRETIVWIDADATVEAPLVELEGEGYDFAAYRDEKGLIYAGTLGFAPTPIRRVLLENWITLNKKRPQKYDQQNLTEVIAEMPGLNVKALPVSYLWVERWHRKMWPDVSAVIQHDVISRSPS